MTRTRLRGTVFCLACAAIWSWHGSYAQSLRARSSAMMPVRLCTSFPSGVPGVRPITTGIDNSVTLATEQWTARFRSAHLRLLPPLMRDDALGNQSVLNPSREARNAATCAQRHDTFGYIGPLNSPVAPSSMPVLNRAGVVQISPSTTDASLTSPGAAIRKAYEPATYAGRLAYVTFYRTITTDALQGAAAAALLQIAFHARTYFLVDDQSPYGTARSGAMAAYASRIGLLLTGTRHLDISAPSTIPGAAGSIADSIVAKQPDGVYYAGYDLYGAQLLKDLRQKGYTGPVVGPDANCDQRYITAAGPLVTNTYCTNPGPDPSANALWFRRAYQRRFHVSPAYFTAGIASLSSFDAPAYDAASIVLNAIYQAALHGQLHGSLYQMRTAILPYVAHVHWHGATGLTSFDGNGDTTNRIVSVYAVRNEKWVYWGAAPPVPGVSPSG